MTWSEPQRGVALGMAGGLAVTLVSLAIGVLVQPTSPLPDALGSRLQLFVFCALVPAMVLAASVARLATHRFLTPQDRDGSGLTPGSERARLLQALVQNTLEQVALALPAYAAWAVLAPPRLLAALPIAAGLFLIGRGLFFWGYAGGAPKRALGFSLTFYPTIVLLAGSVTLAARVAGS